jgi:hypothetical protein
MAESAQKDRKMTDDELLDLIARYERASLGSSAAAGSTIGTNVSASSQQMTTLELDRYNALNMYFARPMGNEVENRSQVVLPELRDTVEWIMPQIMRMFVGAKQICRFDPENQNDTKQAEVESQIVNHVFLKENNGFFILHDFFKDALLLRNGYAKVSWVVEEQTKTERYTGVAEEELSDLLEPKSDGEKVEVLEQREYPATMPGVIGQVGGVSPQPGSSPQPSGGQPPPEPPGMAPSGMPPAMPPGMPPMGAQPGMPPLPAPPPNVFDLKIRRTSKKGRVKVECVPPEEMLISSKARGNLDDIPFSAHKTTATRSDLISEGHERDWVDGLTTGRPNWLDIDAMARNEVTDQFSVESPADRSMQEIEVRDVTIRVDYDGDGIAELRQVLVAGDKIGENEEIEEAPVASCSPIRMPHRHTGISYYDLLADLQVIKTTLFRQGLDNLYLANNTRMGVDWKNCNIDDLLTSRPGGAVRTNGNPAGVLMPIEQPSNLVQQVIPALQYVDSLREMRTGVGRDTMGLDADALQDVTKGGQLAAMSAAGLKIELVARLLAEGVKDLFTKIHGLLIRHQDCEMEFELSGQWVKVNPSEWGRRTRVTPNVGLGSGNREESRANMGMLSQMQDKLGPMGLVGPKQAYETFKLGCEILGYQSPERYAMDPASPEYQQHQQQMAQHPPPPPPPVMVAQIRAQTEQAKMKSQQQLAQVTLQKELTTAQADATSSQQRAQAEIAHAALTNHHDRDVEMAQTLIKVMGQIIASQLKQNASVDAGQLLQHDLGEVL